jgi:hypothetical protein
MLARENLQIRTALANVDIELANARRTQAEAEKQTLRLRERLAPRNLDPEPRNKLKERLKDAKDKGAVSVRFILGDPDNSELRSSFRRS